MISQLEFPAEGSTSPVGVAGRHPVLLLTQCSVDQQTRVSSPTPRHQASSFLPFTIRSSFTPMKSPYKPKSGHSTPTFITSSAHTSNAGWKDNSSLAAAPRPGHVLTLFICSARPSHFPGFLPQGQRPKPAAAPGPLFYTCWFSLEWLSDICLTIHAWCLLQANGGGTPSFPPPLSAPHRSPDAHARVTPCV